jgi:hypothetical protein
MILGLAMTNELFYCHCEESHLFCDDEAISGFEFFKRLNNIRAMVLAALLAMVPLIAGCSDSDNNTPQVEAPQIALTHTSGGIEVRITTATVGAKIIMGLDDSSSLSEFSGLATLTDRLAHRVYAKATKEGMLDSELVSANALPTGSLCFYSYQNCSPQVADSLNVCSSAGQCEKGAFLIWGAQWTVDGVPTWELGTSNFPNQAAINTVGFAIGTTTNNLAKLGSSDQGQIVSGATNTSGNFNTVNTDNPVLCVTPPMSDGSFFAGEANGPMDKCNINGTCTQFLDFGFDTTALGLDPYNYVVWAGTSHGALLRTNVNQASSQTTYTQLNNPIQSIVADGLGNVAVATTQGLYYCNGTTGTGSCSLIYSLSTIETEPNQLLLANDSIYLSTQTGTSIMQFPLPLTQGNYSSINYTGGSIGGWGTDGQNIYVNDATTMGTIYIINSSGTCSEWADIEFKGGGGSGCSAGGAEVMTIVQGNVMNPVRPVLTANPSNLQGDTQSGGCGLWTSLDNIYGPLSISSGLTLDSSSCTGSYPQSCGVTIYTSLGQYNPTITDGFSSVQVSCSCNSAMLDWRQILGFETIGKGEFL